MHSPCEHVAHERSGLGHALISRILLEDLAWTAVHRGYLVLSLPVTKSPTMSVADMDYDAKIAKLMEMCDASVDEACLALEKFGGNVDAAAKYMHHHQSSKPKKQDALASKEGCKSKDLGDVRSLKYAPSLVDRTDKQNVSEAKKGKIYYLLEYFGVPKYFSP